MKPPNPNLSQHPDRAGGRAVLVGVEFTGFPRAAATLPAETSLQELRELTESAGGVVLDALPQRRPQPDAATLIGAGKVNELAAVVTARHADLVIFDADLSPTQQRNLEAAVGVRVVDRTQIILDIFARHARSREGQLQVELAQLDYLLPRLTGRGRALSRLGGGIGTRGPGETQLETDRRRIHHRIRQLRLALERVRRQRAQQRRKRQAVPLATVALVGYTNAGKSTLFNHLTGADVLSSARMFATLDPTLRSLRLPSRRHILLSDTVGFLRNLPHGLITAFRATLEEVTRAQLLLVVSDVNSPERDEHERQVETVLAELGVASTPRIRVWNKIDRLAAADRPSPSGDDAPLLLSARTGEGIPELLVRLDAASVWEQMVEVELLIPFCAARLMHDIHERGEILAERHTYSGVEIRARVPVGLLDPLRPYRRRPQPAQPKNVENA